MPETLTIRPMTDGDLPGVLTTLRAALGETPTLQRTPDLWHWKHSSNPFGPSIVLVAASGGEIAGVRALMRWTLAVPGGGSLSCVRAVDTAVHPGFQRQGVFTRLNAAALEVARDEGVDLVFNTPNAKSRPGYLKQGWRTVGRIGAMVRLTRRFFVTDPLEGVPDARRVLPGAARVATIHTPDRDPQGLRTIRSEEYRRWRFEAHPTASYLRVDAGGATAVLRVNQRLGRAELVVSELFGAVGPEPIRRAARESRAAYLAGWFSPGTPERRAAWRAGMVPVPGYTALTLVARPLRPLDVDVFDLRNWDLATSDLELL